MYFPDSRSQEEVVGPGRLAAEEKAFLDVLLWLSEHHSSWTLGLKEAAVSSHSKQVTIAGQTVPIRPALLLGLFAASEILAKGHPFRPTVDETVGDEEDNFVVQDPILDFYFRDAQAGVTCRIEGARVILSVERPSDAVNLLFELAQQYVAQLNGVLAQASVQSWRSLTLCVEDRATGLAAPHTPRPRADFVRELLPLALSEALARSVLELERRLAREWLERLEALGVLLLERLGARGRRRQEPTREAGAVRAALLCLGEEGAGARAEWGRELRENAEFLGRETLVSRVHLALRELEAGQGDCLLATRRAVAEGFASQVLQPFVGVGEIVAVLDLLSIYTLGATKTEPRVEFADEVVKTLKLWLLRMLGAKAGAQVLPHSGVLHLLFHASWSAPRTRGNGLRSWWLGSFHGIVYPAWRFFARSWHDDIEPLLMARACIDLGSSRFRSEFQVGILRLLEGKVMREEKDPDRAFAHSGCTICSAHLLYVFSAARLYHTAKEVEKLRDSEGRSLSETVGGLLRFFLERTSDSRAWGGFGLGKGAEEGVYSMDYLAWATKAVAFYAFTRESVRARTGKAWPEGIGEGEVSRLVRERTMALLQLTRESMLDVSSEEPHTRVLGYVSLAYRDVAALRRRCRLLGEVLFPEAVWKRESSAFRAALRAAYYDLLGGCSPEAWFSKYVRVSVDSGTPEPPGRSLALIDRLFLWPAQILDLEFELDELRERRDKKAVWKALCGEASESSVGRKQEALAQTFRECLESPVWIAPGRLDGGSWGYNRKNTQAIVIALAAFLRHAWEDPLIRKGYDRFLREEDLPKRFKELLHPDDPAASGPGKPS
ncbi:MAG: hypothetical protein U0002_18605 [Thermoanaerobaculia bacterium]